MGIQTQNADGTYTFTISSSAGSITPATGTVWTLGASYSVYCTLPGGMAPGTVVTYTPYNYSAYTTNNSGGSFGLAGPNYPHLDPTIGNVESASPTSSTILTLTQEWNAVNWIINKGSVDGASVLETQHVVWQILHPDGLDRLRIVPGITAAAGQLYVDAIANDNFIPQVGDYVAVLMVPTTPANQARLSRLPDSG